MQNNANATVTKLTLTGVTSPDPTFGFDGDGLCTIGSPPGNPQPGCPFGPTGYEGPNTAFSNISPDQSTGDVDFPSGLARGAFTYFSLEGTLNASDVVIAPIPGLSGGGKDDHDREHDHDPSTSTTTPAAPIAASPAFTG